MTVAELIEDLQGLPGDPSLRAVVVRVLIQREHAPDATVDGRLTRVEMTHDIVTLQTGVFIE